MLYKKGMLLPIRIGNSNPGTCIVIYICKVFRMFDMCVILYLVLLVRNEW